MNLRILLLVLASQFWRIWSFTTGNGANSLFFSGLKNDARFRTPETSISSSGSLLFNVLLPQPSHDRAGIQLGSNGGIAHFRKSEDNSVFVSMDDYDEIVLIFEDVEYYGLANPPENEWMHISLIWAPKLNNETFIDFKLSCWGVNNYEETFSFDLEDFGSFDGFFEFGKASELPDDLPLIGNMDNICYFTREISSEELDNVRKFGCEVIDDSNKEMSFDFEDIREIPPQIKEKVSNEYKGLLRFTNLSEFGLTDTPLIFGNPIYPVTSPLASPIQNTGFQTVQINSEGSTSFYLNTDGDSATKWRLLVDDLSILTLGSLTVGSANIAVTAGVVQTSMNLKFTPNNALSESLRIEMFCEVLDETEAEIKPLKLTLYPISVPQCSEASVTVNENEESVIYLPNELYFSNVNHMFLLPLLTELPELESVSFRTLPLEATEIWENGTSIDLGSSGPILLPEARFSMKHDELISEAIEFDIKLKLFNGLSYSDTCPLRIIIQAKNKPPIPKDTSVTIIEDIKETITLPYDEMDGEPVIAMISKFPSLGTLYQYNSDQEIQFQSATSMSSQWVKSAEVSSFWPAAGYGADSIIGAADVYPDYGDQEGAWQPSMEGDWWDTQWVIAEIETPVVVTNVYLFETWHPAALKRVLLKNSETDEWEVAWEGIWTFKESNPDSEEKKSTISTYSICPKPFQTSFVKFEFELTEEHWYALDAIQIEGLLEVPVNVILDSQMRVDYVPNAEVNGIDEFTFTMNDCNFYQTSRNLNPEPRSATGALTISAVNDTPQAKNSTFQGFDENSLNIALAALDFDLPNFNSDGKYNDELTFVATSLPEFGVLVHIASKTTIKKDEKIDPYLMYVPDLCDRGDETVFDTFKFSVFDEDGKFDTGTIAIIIECLDKAFELNSGTLDMYIILSVVLFLQVIILVVMFSRNRRHMVVRLASFRFSLVGLMFSLLGIVIGFLNVSQTKIACILRPFVTFCLMAGYCGMLFFKSLRISMLLNNKQLRFIRMTDKRLFTVMFLPFFLLMMFFGAILSTIGMDCELDVPSTTEEGYLITHCEYQNWAFIAMILLWITGFAALSWISYRVRHAPMELNDANHIIVAVMLLMVYFVFKFSLEFMNFDSPNLDVVIDGIGFIAVLITCNFVLFSAKIIHIRELESTMARSTMFGGRTSMDMDTMCRYKQPNKSAISGSDGDDSNVDIISFISNASNPDNEPSCTTTSSVPRNQRSSRVLTSSTATSAKRSSNRRQQSLLLLAGGLDFDKMEPLASSFPMVGMTPGQTGSDSNGKSDFSDSNTNTVHSNRPINSHNTIAPEPITSILKRNDFPKKLGTSLNTDNRKTKSQYADRSGEGFLTMDESISSSVTRRRRSMAMDMRGLDPSKGTLSDSDSNYPSNNTSVHTATATPNINTVNNNVDKNTCIMTMNEALDISDEAEFRAFSARQYNINDKNESRIVSAEICSKTPTCTGDASIAPTEDEPVGKKFASKSNITAKSVGASGVKPSPLQINTPNSPPILHLRLDVSPKGLPSNRGDPIIDENNLVRAFDNPLSTRDSISSSSYPNRHIPPINGLTKTYSATSGMSNVWNSVEVDDSTNNTNTHIEEIR